MYNNYNIDFDKIIFIIPKKDKYGVLLQYNLLDFDLWYIMDEERVLNRLKGVTERYPNRKLIPFARRDDNDDIACFEVGKGEKV